MRLYEIENNDLDLLKKYKAEVNFAIEKYKKYNFAIFRGSKTYNQSKVMFSNPASRIEPRKSAMNIGNYYTLWMDNNPEWAEYPKRSKSLICTSCSAFANWYGFVKVVIPLVNTKIGVCPEIDIWKSFNSVKSLGEFSDWLKDDVFKN